MNEYIAANVNHAPPQEFYAQGFVPHSEVPGRVLEIERALRESSVGTLIYPENFLSVTRDLLSFIHDPKYVSFILDSAEREKNMEGYRYATTFPYRRGTRLPDHAVGTLGFYSFDTYTPVHANLTKAVLSSANASYTAAIDLLKCGGR